MLFLEPKQCIAAPVTQGHDDLLMHVPSINVFMHMAKLLTNPLCSSKCCYSCCCSAFWLALHGQRQDTVQPTACLPFP
jgi:hypothetical protein